MYKASVCARVCCVVTDLHPRLCFQRDLKIVSGQQSISWQMPQNLVSTLTESLFMVSDILILLLC